MSEQELQFCANLFEGFVHDDKVTMSFGGVSTTFDRKTIGAEFYGGYDGIRVYTTHSSSWGHKAVNARASGSTVSNIAIYGSATGTNAWGGWFDGNVYTSGTYSSSDIKFKKNIANIMP